MRAAVHMNGHAFSCNVGKGSRLAVCHGFVVNVTSNRLPSISTIARIFLACIAIGLLFGSLGCTRGLPRAADAVHLPLPSDHYRLPNGLEVVLHRDGTFDTVLVDVRYHVGSKDDPERESGFAHLQEHLTFRRKKGGGKTSETLTSML